MPSLVLASSGGLAGGDVGADLAPALDLARHAVRAATWQLRAELIGHGTAAADPHVSSAPQIDARVVIAAPDGRAAAWMGILPTRRRTLDDAVAALTGDARVAWLWGDGQPRQGARDGVPLALAAARALHARAHGQPPAERDAWLAAYLELPARERPPTAALLGACDDALAAGLALATIGRRTAARALLRGAAGRVAP